MYIRGMYTRGMYVYQEYVYQGYVYQRYVYRRYVYQRYVYQRYVYQRYVYYFFDEFFRRIFLMNFFDVFFRRIFSMNFFNEFLQRIFSTNFYLLTIASFRIGVPSILFWSIFSLIRDMVVESCNRRFGCETIPQKNYIYEFVANVLHDNISILIFDLHGGSQRPNTK